MSQQHSDILIDLAEVENGLPEFNQNIECAVHPSAQIVEGFGLAGGGFGPYTMCERCCRILTKSVEKDDE